MSHTIMASGGVSCAFPPTSPRPRPTSRASATASAAPPPRATSPRGRRAVRGRARRPPALAPVQAARGGRPQREARRRHQPPQRESPPVQAERPRRRDHEERSPSALMLPAILGPPQPDRTLGGVARLPATRRGSNECAASGSQHRAHTPAGAPGRTAEEQPSARAPVAAGAAPAKLRRPTGKTGARSDRASEL